MSIIGRENLSYSSNKNRESGLGGQGYFGYNRSNQVNHSGYSDHENFQQSPGYGGKETKEGQNNDREKNNEHERVNYEERALALINEICQRDDERAKERYRGLLGRVREWFDREGRRQASKTLKEAGLWVENSKYKKWLKYGLKIGGGIGLAATMTFTGGVGALLTPILWTAGVREGWDGILQAVERIGWGKKRSGVEIEAQTALNLKIEEFKGAVLSSDHKLTEEEFGRLVEELLNIENMVAEKQKLNMIAERKWALGRSIASSALTIGTGLLTGIPLGTAKYSMEKTGHATEILKPGGKGTGYFLDKQHRVFWNLKDKAHFLYNNPHELHRAQMIAKRFHSDLTPFSDFFQRSAHTLGHGLPTKEKWGLILSGGYLLGRWLEQYLGGKGAEKSNFYDSSSTPPYSLPGDPYPPSTPPSPYGPSGYDRQENFPYTGETLFSDQEIEELKNKIGNIDDPDKQKKWLAYEIYQKRILTNKEGDDQDDWKMAERLLADWKQEKEGGKDASKEKQTIIDYLAGQNQDYVAELNRQNEGLEPMSEKCRLAICIPAVYSEHRTIYHALEQFIKQQTNSDGHPLDNEVFEIDIFVNGPTNKRQEIEETLSAIKWFQHDHPEVKVNAISKEYPEGATIGEVRKYINDFALLRASKRDRYQDSLILVSNDADLVDLEPGYLSKALNVFDKDKEVEMIAGKVDYNKEDYKKYPFLLAARRLWQFVDIVRKHKNAKQFLPKTLGGNSFIRANAYAEVGGYKKDAWVAEDLTVAQDVAEKYGTKSIRYRNIKAVLNPRRDLAAIEKGEPLVKAYDNFGMEEEMVRNKLTPLRVEQLNFSSEKNEKLFKKRLEEEAAAIFESLWESFFWYKFDRLDEVRARRENNRAANVEDLVTKYRNDFSTRREVTSEANNVFKRAMGLWGAKYELFERKGRFRVSITDWSKLKDGLERY